MKESVGVTTDVEKAAGTITAKAQLIMDNVSETLIATFLALSIIHYQLSIIF